MIMVDIHVVVDSMDAKELSPPSMPTSTTTATLNLTQNTFDSSLSTAHHLAADEAPRQTSFFDACGETKKKKKKKKKRNESRRERMRFASFLVVSLATFAAVHIGVRGESVHEHFVAEHAKLRRSLSLDEVESRFDVDHDQTHTHHRHGCRVDNDDPQRDRKNCTKKSTSAIDDDESVILLGLDDDSIHHSMFRKRYLGDPSAACIESICDVPDVAPAISSRFRTTDSKTPVSSCALSRSLPTTSQSPHISKTDTSSQSFILNQGFLPVGVFFSVVAENIASTPISGASRSSAISATFDRCRFDVL
jgi:hypothetical protein